MKSEAIAHFFKNLRSCLEEYTKVVADGQVSQKFPISAAPNLPQDHARAP